MEFLTLYEAGKICGVSLKDVSEWISQGLIPASTTGDGHCRIKRKDLQAFMRRQGILMHKMNEEDRKKILVVDDNKLLVDTIVEGLQEEPYHYEIISASDGFEAAVQIRDAKPDLLVLDIMMPDIDGHEVCRKLKSDETAKEIKIIVLSAYLDDENLEKMKQCGADACFSKPLSLKSLKKEIRRMLGIEVPENRGETT